MGRINNPSVARGMLILCAALLQFGALKAQEVSVLMRTDKEDYLIGEYAALHISVTADRLTEILWPSFSDTLSGGLHLLKTERVDTVKDRDGLHHYHQVLIVSAYDSGQYVIEPIEILYRQHGSDIMKPVSTGTLTLTFKLVEVDQESGIRDIKGPLETPFSFIDLLPWIGLALIILFAAIIIVRYLRKRKQTIARDVIPTLELTPLLPWQRALAELELLRSRLPSGHHDVKLFYVELSGILRIYLRDGLGIDAPDLTTRQAIRRLSALSNISSELHQSAHHVLHLSDLVKFAKTEPGEPEHLQLTDEAIRFVVCTAPAHIQPIHESEET